MRGNIIKNELACNGGLCGEISLKIFACEKIAPQASSSSFNTENTKLAY